MVEFVERIVSFKNVDGDPDTTATILVENSVDYTPKVSIITPVYNVEEYLRECLDSVTAQTLKEIEIICIDDGSTDNSLNILEKIDGIKLIKHTENKGQLAAIISGLTTSSVSSSYLCLIFKVCSNIFYFLLQKKKKKNFLLNLIQK